MNNSTELARNIEGLKNAKNLKQKSTDWINESAKYKYSYNFSWLGRRAIQFPNDTWAMQELIWDIKPDLIIETGIAHGGSLIFSASMLALLDYTDAVHNKTILDPKKSKRKVIGIDIDIRDHNRDLINAHPLSHKIEMIQGSSIAKEVVEEVHQKAEGFGTILVCLDSNHTHDHVLEELEAYSNLVSINSYLVVFDTVIEYMDEASFSDRPWGVGNNPKTAVDKFIAGNTNFEIDYDIDAKLQISVAPSGFLKRKK
tara:strand:- start:760 stop:1527 length:768 start_codon:yes stop_codon:yes gene_type:complete